MKNFKQTKQFLFRLFLAGIFLILYAVTASAVPVSAQGGISDNQRKASASLITWDAYQGLDEAELSSGVWRFCGRAELGALTGETYYDGALYVETLGDRSGGFVFEGGPHSGFSAPSGWTLKAAVRPLRRQGAHERRLAQRLRLQRTPPKLRACALDRPRPHGPRLLQHQPLRLLRLQPHPLHRPLRLRIKYLWKRLINIY